MYLLDSALRGRSGAPARRASDEEAQLSAWRDLAGQWASDVDHATEVRQTMKRSTRGREVDL